MKESGIKGVVKIKDKVNFIGKVSSFTVLGDPGCDGLGVEIMTTFSKAMSCTQTDFKIILGDLVPLGVDHFYKHIHGIINDISRNPVYTLCGNHDTEYYEAYFGLRNYILVNDDLLFIVLDNSKRVFEAGTLNFLGESLKGYPRKNILVLFHIPPPNRFSSNSIKPEEWQKLKAVMDPYKDRIKYVLSGHVHSYFQDDVDGYKVVVSAGAGARLDFFGRLPDKKSSFHHVLRFSFDKDSQLVYEYVSLADVPYDREIKDEGNEKNLSEALRSESMAYIRYRFYADDAHENGFLGIEKLFRALSASAFYHAKNYFSVLNQLRGIRHNLAESRDHESGALDKINADYLPYSKESHSPLTQYALFEASEAKKNYAGFLPEAIRAFDSREDIGMKTYYVCTSCGNMLSADHDPDNCPICGAPRDKIIKM